MFPSQRLTALSLCTNLLSSLQHRQMEEHAKTSESPPSESFSNFDADKDGHLNFNEAQLVIRTLSDYKENSLQDFVTLCNRYGCDPDKGVSPRAYEEILQGTDEGGKLFLSPAWDPSYSVTLALILKSLYALLHPNHISFKHQVKSDVDNPRPMRMLSATVLKRRKWQCRTSLQWQGEDCERLWTLRRPKPPCNLLLHVKT